MPPHPRWKTNSKVRARINLMIHPLFILSEVGYEKQVLINHPFCLSLGLCKTLRMAKCLRKSQPCGYNTMKTNGAFSPSRSRRRSALALLRTSSKSFVLLYTSQRPWTVRLDHWAAKSKFMVRWASSHVPFSARMQWVSFRTTVQM